MITRTFYLYEQTIADTDQHYLAELEFTPKHPGQVSDSHGLHLSLRRPDDKLSFAELAIEYRNGQLSIMVWPQPEDLNGDPIVFHPNPDNSPYCLKCGDIWQMHENGCIQE